MGFKKALKLPIVMKYNTKILSLDGQVFILGHNRFVIGFGKISEIDNSRERSIIKFDGEIVVESPCSFGPGSRIISERNSKLFIGAHFNNTAKLTISNCGNIEIGKHCLVSWDTWICDTDFHHIINKESDDVMQSHGAIRIGDQVWICANSSVIKGANIADGCIVATGAIVNKYFSEKNCLLAGVPAIEKKHHVTWLS